MKENIYIQILKFGRDKLNSELNYVDLEDKIQEISGQDKTFAEAIAKTFFITEIGRKVYLKGDALFNLIQYERIEETRKESKISYRVALVAIVLTLIGTILNVIGLFK